MRHINRAGLELIKKHEGLRLTAYQCPAGIWTIAWGHTQGVQKGDTVTEARAEDLLREDLVKFEHGVERLLFEDVNDNQFSALVCFAFNVGLENRRVSTLLKKLNLGDSKGAAEQFLRWNKAAGKVLPGLVTRREAEKTLFLS